MAATMVVGSLHSAAGKFTAFGPVLCTAKLATMAMAAAALAMLLVCLPMLAAPNLGNA